MFRKNKYLHLQMGLVKENFVIVPRTEADTWRERGFAVIRKYPLFHRTLYSKEVILLGKPLTIAEFGTEQLINSIILDICPFCGTYGMGGPGFFGIKLQGDWGIRWLTYCIWAAGEHLLLNDRVLECAPAFSHKYNPWIASGNDTNDLADLKRMLTGLSIRKLDIDEENIFIQIGDQVHASYMLTSHKNSDLFPEQGGTLKKRSSFETGTMHDYWLITYDGTHLAV